MASSTQPGQLTDVLYWESDLNFNREAVTVVSGQNLTVGDIVGQITKLGTATSAPYGTNTGDGVMGTVTPSAGTVQGDYRLTITAAAANAGAFEVEDPNGVGIGTGNVAAAFSAGGIAFTLADGAADFIVGDGFTLSVTVGSNKWAIYNDAATDGTEVAAGVLLFDTDASAADATGTILARGPAIVKDTGMGWNGQSATPIANGKADLALLDIITRTGL